MNIFVLDNDPEMAAKYHCDKHVVKMILEYAQLMSTAHRELDGPDFADREGLYKSTHKNHPCAIWTRESSSNYDWLYQLFVETHHEYSRRYGKIHKTYAKLAPPLAARPINIPHKAMTPFCLAMPDDCKRPDAVDAYREYYMREKRAIAVWHKGEYTPWWYR